MREWLSSFGDDETLRSELDFQYILLEPKLFNDQSTQTNENEAHRVNTRDMASSSDESEPFALLSTPDVIEPMKKRLRNNYK